MTQAYEANKHIRSYRIDETDIFKTNKLYKDISTCTVISSILNKLHLKKLILFKFNGQIVYILLLIQLRSNGLHLKMDLNISSFIYLLTNFYKRHDIYNF